MKSKFIRLIELLIIVLFLSFFFSCKEKEDEKEKENEDTKYYTPELIDAIHQVDVDNDEVSPYIVIKGLPYDEETIDYSIIVFLNFPKNYQGDVLTKRYYNYLQCDYYTSNESTIYYHNFDHLPDDGGHLSNAFNIAPRYNTKDYLTKISFNLKYEYELENKIEKEIIFNENIFSFDESKFSDIISKAVEEENRYSFDVIITKNEDEDFNRYKLIINLDSENVTGHYDIQTWIECGERIIPFVGYYHYRVGNGDIMSVSDEKVNVNENVSAIYYMVRFYDSNGNITDTYYQKRID